MTQKQQEATMTLEIMMFRLQCDYNILSTFIGNAGHDFRENYEQVCEHATRDLEKARQQIDLMIKAIAFSPSTTEINLEIPA